MDDILIIKDIYIKNIIHYTELLEQKRNISKCVPEIIQYDVDSVFDVTGILFKISEAKDRLYSIDNFLKNTCEHEIIDDHIDVDPEKSINISYCSKCKLTF
jgi:hypothetical protein